MPPPPTPTPRTREGKGERLPEITVKANAVKWLTGYCGNRLSLLWLLIPRSLCHPIFRLETTNENGFNFFFFSM